jgi:WD40 repeat protein
MVHDKSGVKGMRNMCRISEVLIATCDYDKLVKVWEEEKGCIQTLSGHSGHVRNV